MAVGAYSTAEIRTTGAATNSGAFDGSAGAAQLSPTDLTCDQGGVTIGSVVGGFTAGMVGACLVFTGAGNNFERGQIRIATYIDTNTVTVDHSPCPFGAGTAGVATVSAGTDYSQQAGSQANGTNGTLTHTTTTFVDATANAFTAAMVGNWIRIQGTNFTTGWYEITGYTDAATVTLDRDPTPASNGSAGVWAVGGALYALDATLDTFLETLVAGCKAWIKAGTYTLTGTLSIYFANDATSALPIRIVGYNAVRGDNPTGTNRPLIAAGSQQAAFTGDFWETHHLRVTTTHVSGWQLAGAGCRAINCASNNNSSSGGRPAFSIVSGVNQSLIACEATSLLGQAVSGTNNSGVRIINCWCHDSANGVDLSTGANWVISGTSIEQCGTGISVTTASGLSFLGNTIVHCGTGILATGASGANVIANNILAYNKLGASWSGGVDQLSNFYSHNNWYGNVADVSNAHHGADDTAIDPEFTLHTWSDLACSDHAGPPFNVTSVAAGFDTYFQVGDWFYISINTGNWVAGAYRVTAVAAGTLSLATDPTNGSNATSGTAQTLRTGVGVSDCRLGAGSTLNTVGMNLELGVG